MKVKSLSRVRLLVTPWTAALQAPLSLGGTGRHWQANRSRQEKKGTTEDQMVGWHHRLDVHKFEQAPGVADGQGSLACCSPWGHKESDRTE